MSQQQSELSKPTGPSVTGEAHALMFQANLKSPLIAYGLWFFFGWVCAHCFYLGMHTQALIRIGLAVVSFWLMATLVAPLLGWLGFVILAVWWILDAFLIPNLVVKANIRDATHLATPR